MTELIRKLWHAYYFIFEELPDPRTKNLFLAAKPYQGILLLAVYLMFVFKWGPRWMKNRPPFNLNKLLIFYNALQILSCAYVAVYGIWYAWGWDYKWICEPVDFSTNYKAMQIAYLCYFYYILKIIDLADTVFFILRKKFNQVTFLHVYHHTGMVMLIWGNATYYPGGHGTLVGLINCFVHVVMYSYYLVTVIYPNAKQSSWKKYITQLQILQFLLDVIHMSTVVFKSDCEYPRWSAALFLPQNIFMLILFIDFYIKAYIRRPKAIVRPRILKENTNILKETAIKKDDIENEVFVTAYVNKRNIPKKYPLSE